jgi:hypothetical protein
VDVDRARVAVGAVAPDRPQQLLAVEQPAGIGHQRVEQLELAEGQLHRLAVDRHLALRAVERDRPDDQHLGAHRPGARRAQHRADAAAQLGQPERLGDVVVAARLEPEHRVGLGVERRQHDDRHDVAPGAQRPADLVAVGAGPSATSSRTMSKCSVLARSIAPPVGDAITRWPSRENERVSISRRSDSSSTTRMLSDASAPRSRVGSVADATERSGAIRGDRSGHRRPAGHQCALGGDRPQGHDPGERGHRDVHPDHLRRQVQLVLDAADQPLRGEQDPEHGQRLERVERDAAAGA